jgi:hypothetical protein
MTFDNTENNRDLLLHTPIAEFFNDRETIFCPAKLKEKKGKNFPIDVKEVVLKYFVYFFPFLLF